MRFLHNGVTGHRGNPEEVPENTLPGFENAIALGVDFLETDVRESADHVLFLCHDATTGRTCGTDLVIAETEAAELRKLNAACGFAQGVSMPIPTLDELLALVASHSRIRLSLQPKCPAVGAICEAVKKVNLTNRIAFNDGNFDWIAEAKERIPEAVIFYDTYGIEQLEHGIGRAKAAGFHGIVAHKGSLTRERVDAVIAEGLEPGVWVVNDEAEMRRFFEMGVFRVYTDRPALALALKKEWKCAESPE
ncbi:MAG: cytoplasmic glycerophosphodiester phosphodiesterase [Lentisphaerae bacterium ADurb.Bin242]|nr:MAG: cytoplasmic glycerophosphodiester phosphodiesterase [Lentisphaerae bacterium ADurb.Bin242]